MFQRQGMLLKGGVAVGHRRMAGVAGLRRKTEIRNLQIPQLRRLQVRITTTLQLLMAGMQRQQQKNGQACCCDKQILY